jgi:hypothetical protein
MNSFHRSVAENGEKVFLLKFAERTLIAMNWLYGFKF